jgi:hypothetical protein
MSLSNFTRLGVLLAGGLLLAHCASPQSVVPSLGNSSGGIARAPSTLRPSHRESWMAKGINQRDLLYVSNANGTVNVYTYWQHNLVGVLTNFTQPLGECTDQASNVYIVDYQKAKISEYAHGGTKPLKVLDDSPNSPTDCAVSPPSGNVAVANSAYDRYTKGNIAIYPRGTGTPKIYYGNAYNDHFNGVAYDDRGDLLTTSTFSYLNWYTEFYYLPSHGSQLILMNLPPPQGSGWDFVQDVGWDGKYWLVLSSNTIYRYTINVKAKMVDSIKLYGGSYDISAMALYRKSSKSFATQVAGPNGTASKASVEYWHYPSGGSPYATITKGLDQPGGIAISLRTQ